MNLQRVTRSSMTLLTNVVETAQHYIYLPRAPGDSKEAGRGRVLRKIVFPRSAERLLRHVVIRFSRRRAARTAHDTRWREQSALTGSNMIAFGPPLLKLPLRQNDLSRRNLFFPGYSVRSESHWEKNCGCAELIYPFP